MISTRNIELHCPPEWKRKTKPKNEKTSFSKQVEDKPQQQIPVTQDGKSVIIDETSRITETYPTNSDYVSQPYDQSAQNGMGVHDNSEAGTPVTDTKEELVITHSLNGEIAPVNKQNEDR